jgi:hypothetical protein
VPCSRDCRCRLVSLAHAWLRNGTVVYDPVLDLICDADAYQGNAAVSYVTKEAAETAVAHGHYGPWVQLDGH